MQDITQLAYSAITATDAIIIQVGRLPADPPRPAAQILITEIHI